MPLRDAKTSFLSQLESFGVEYEGQDESVAETFPASDPTVEQAPGAAEPRAAPSPVAVAEPQRHRVPVRGTDYEIEHGSVVIAAITSCTNTSNPQVMVGAGLLAKKAVERGLTRKPWVKSSLAPGSKVVTEYYERAGLTEPLEQLGFHTVGYGCTTCIGNSGPLPEPISEAVAEGDLVVCSVLSGNRNFEARIHSEVKANYLASPPLVVAYAIAGRMDIDLVNEPLDGDVYLQDIWPTPQEIQDVITESVRSEMFERTYADVFTGDENWRALPDPQAGVFAWDPDSTYVRRPPYFDGMQREPQPVEDISGARCLVVIGDSVTTDHISPAGAIRPDSPAGKYLIEHGVERKDFNSYGSRRGNHEVMVRGTFANVRLRNLMVAGQRGDVDAARPERRRADDLRGVRALPRRGNAADRDRGQGVRLGLVARLGGEGPEPARRPSGDRRELRADPPLEPADDGRAPAPVPRRRRPRVARPDRARGVLDRGDRERRGARGHRPRRRQGVPRAGAARHPARARVPAARRHPPLRAAPSLGGVTEPALRPFRRLRMGRVVLFVLLAVLAGLLAVSGTARTLGADGTPAPAAFQLADGSAGCVYDGERIACKTASMTSAVVLEPDGSSAVEAVEVDWNDATPVLRSTESWWHDGYSCRIADAELLCERGSGTIAVGRGGVGAASSATLP